MASIPRPLTGSLAGRWDHRIEQQQQCDSHLFANERRDEASQRLRDENDAFWIPITDRLDDGGSIFRKAGMVIRRRQFNRDNLMAVHLQLRRYQMPVPCA